MDVLGDNRGRLVGQVGEEGLSRTNRVSVNSGGKEKVRWTDEVDVGCSRINGGLNGLADLRGRAVSGRER